MICLLVFMFSYAMKRIKIKGGEKEHVEHVKMMFEFFSQFVTREEMIKNRLYIVNLFTETDSYNINKNYSKIYDTIMSCILHTSNVEIHLRYKINTLVDPEKINTDTLKDMIGFTFSPDKSVEKLIRKYYKPDYALLPWWLFNIYTGELMEGYYFEKMTNKNLNTISELHVLMYDTGYYVYNSKSDITINDINMLMFKCEFEIQIMNRNVNVYLYDEHPKDMILNGFKFEMFESIFKLSNEPYEENISHLRELHELFNDDVKQVELIELFIDEKIASRFKCFGTKINTLFRFGDFDTLLHTITTFNQLKLMFGIKIDLKFKKLDQFSSIVYDSYYAIDLITSPATHIIDAWFDAESRKELDNSINDILELYPGIDVAIILDISFRHAKLTYFQWLIKYVLINYDTDWIKQFIDYFRQMLDLKPMFEKLLSEMDKCINEKSTKINIEEYINSNVIYGEQIGDKFIYTPIPQMLISDIARHMKLDHLVPVINDQYMFTDFILEHQAAK